MRVVGWNVIVVFFGKKMERISWWWILVLDGVSLCLYLLSFCEQVLSCLIHTTWLLGWLWLYIHLILVHLAVETDILELVSRSSMELSGKGEISNELDGL